MSETDRRAVAAPHRGAHDGTVILVLDHAEFLFDIGHHEAEQILLHVAGAARSRTPATGSTGSDRCARGGGSGARATPTRPARGWRVAVRGLQRADLRELAG